ncbi:MAG: transposase [Xanthomonadales bacterium]|nr:transposase [Xanthomonadales bacterium]
MHDRELYRQILGIQAPWEVTDVDVDLPGTGVTVHIHHSGEGLACPQCEASCSGYDTRERKWRHLDTCKYKTWLVAQSRAFGVRARIPSAAGALGGEQQPTDGPVRGAGDRLAQDRHDLGGRCAARLELVCGQRRAGTRGGARLHARQQDFPDAIGIDETAFQHRRQYVTVIGGGDRVLHVADDRKRSTLDAWYAAQPAEALHGLRTVAMDMWGPFIDSTLAHVPGAERKIAFDRFTSPSTSAMPSTRSAGPSTRPCWRTKATRS